MASTGCDSFAALDPATGRPLAERFPVSDRAECERALAAADAAFARLATVPRDEIARFLDEYAAAIDAHADELAALAAHETGLPVSPRLKDVELPRTTGQLRQAAAACREGSWALPTIDTKGGIRSVHAALGPVLVIGPNNFPFAFNGIAGGDFAAALAAGNPVIAKGHPSHPATTRRLAELADGWRPEWERSQPSNRASQAHGLRVAGKTYADIGAALGVSSGRAHQLVQRCKRRSR
jgi:NADP-dependent aldehyde dehydrogenase